KARRLLAYQPKVKLEEGLAIMIDWIKSRGPRPFLHNVDLEIDGPLAPKTWSKKIL
ncbi:MAG: epimerase, partial [Desulfuromonas sp.]